MIGRTLSHFRITRLLGKGGMGEVYQAEDLHLHRTVALKFIVPERLADPAARKRFLREARAAASLDHPNVCTVHAIEEVQGHTFITMAFIEGQDLQERLTAGPLPLPEALGIASQIAAGLDAAHARGIVHRDVKSANVMISPEGRVQVMDFGLATVPDRGQVTKVGSLLGTVPYMSPEQLRGQEVDHRTDIWSLGVVLFEMLTGRLPFGGEGNHSVMLAILDQEPAPLVAELPDSQAGLQGILNKALAKDPDQRYQNATDMIRDLEDLHGGKTVRITPPAGRRAGRGGSRLGLRVGLLLAILAGAGLLAWKVVIRPRPAIPFDKRDWILITEFENRTGEEVFEGTVREALSFDLEQSRHVNVFGGRRLTEALSRMGHKGGIRINAQLGRELAQREGITILLEGMISKLEETYLIGARLINPATGDAVDTERVTAASREHIFPAIDLLSHQIRKNLGESLISIGRRDEPLARVTTGSLQALRHYTRGNEYLQAADWENAITHLTEAIAIDTTFAIAYAKLGRLYFMTARTHDALQNSEMAMRHRQRTGERERYYIEAEYFRYRAEYDKAIEKFNLLLSEYPDAVDVRNNLATTYMWALQYDKALDQIRQAVQLAPESWYVHHAKANAHGGLAQYDQAIREFNVAKRLNPGQLRSRDCLSWLLICQGRVDRARTEQDSLAAVGGGNTVSVQYRRGKFHFFLGENEKAREFFQAALDEARRKRDSNQEAWILLYLANLQHACGQDDQAAGSLRAAVELWPGALPLAHLGRAHIRSGDAVAAGEMLERLEALADREPTNHNRSFVLYLRAEILIQNGSLPEAARALEEALQLYHRFEGRLALARVQADLGEIKKARQTVASVTRYPYTAFLDGEGEIWPASYYLLGRFAEMAADTSGAVSAYQKAVTIWEGADPGHRLASEARARHRRLTGSAP